MSGIDLWVRQYFFEAIYRATRNSGFFQLLYCFVTRTKETPFLHYPGDCFMMITPGNIIFKFWVIKQIFTPDQFRPPSKHLVANRLNQNPTVTSFINVTWGRV